MDVERMSVLFAQLDHWDVVADPGTHSYKEVMPAAVYGWPMDMAGWCSWQRLRAAKAGFYVWTPRWTQLSFPMCNI